MTLSLETAFFVSLLIAILILAGYIEWSFARGRLMKKRQTKMTAAVARDDAYNASVTSKAILRNLRAQGYDVSAAEPFVRQSDAELEMGNFTNARLLAEDAKKTLFNIKAKGIRPLESPAGRQQGTRQANSPAVKSDDFPVQPANGKASVEKKLPKNYAEASFTMRSVEIELGKAGDVPAAAKARAILAEADNAFNAEDYDGALRLAVRASKTMAAGSVEGSIQAIPPQDRTEHAASASTADQHISICGSCGAELLEGDSFCRKCGAKIGAACPSCGNLMEEGDTFCGKCGSRL